jgi:hypothetical protein
MRTKWLFSGLAAAAAVSCGSSAQAANDAELEPPVQVEVAGEPLDTGGVGYAAPFYADFDGDGVKDLLVGEFAHGRLRIYRNTGSDTAPKLESHVFFKDDAAGGRIPAG